ncbi:PP2C family protein-serine/threonine phosphatase [Denitrobaculum tricleocarpae]|uniref:Serine/threonine-protein phosphatase n=1 Tax=Denitrobaculum tricleocarpae TaxID=2591009 RepID=A0A545TQ39_9PROT|nr:PP2C family serine/threonine-protein phosphatase [Denitrobaculum tricleocarpae]TQV79329.1 serine/threonine-protein phosphatase [Denitrobaculum tricleocarpae]
MNKKMVARLLRVQKHSLWETAILQRLGDRETQQDRAGYRVASDASCCILVAADGLGGHQGGEEAAAAAVSAMLESWRGQPGTDEATLRRCIDEAQEQVAEVSRRFAHEARTTCVALVLGQSEACWSHLGDSRLYVFRQGDTIYKSKDHSVARLMLQSGELNEEEARTGPEQGRLYKSLGPDTGQEYQVSQTAVTSEDRYVLCTDGFWVNVSEAEMGAALQAPDLEEAFGALADLAVTRARGESDNVTVCAARPLFEVG